MSGRVRGFVLDDDDVERVMATLERVEELAKISKRARPYSRETCALLDAMADCRLASKAERAFSTVKARIGTDGSADPSARAVVSPDDAISVREATAILGCSERWVRELCDRGELVACQRGDAGTWAISRECVLERAGR